MFPFDTGASKIFWLEPRERRRHVRPSIEPVPSEREFVQDVVGKIAQTKTRHEALEIAPVQHVELAKRNAA